MIQISMRRTAAALDAAAIAKRAHFKLLLKSQSTFASLENCLDESHDSVFDSKTVPSSSLLPNASCPKDTTGGDAWR